MASTGKKWAIGCGIGCGLVLIVLGGIGTSCYFAFKPIAERAEEMEVHLEELDERYGPMQTYTPPTDGAMDAATVETFLAVRRDLQDSSVEVVETLGTLEGDAGGIAKVKAGMALIPTILSFIGQRAEVLLVHDMHPGEYMYIYGVVYYSWLGHDPGDGPDFQLNGNNGNDGFQWEVDDSTDVHTERARAVRRDLNGLMIAWLENQQEALHATGDIDSEWAQMLADELAALEDDRRHLAWQDGLPRQLADSLAPYRTELEAAYTELLNGLEASIIVDD